MIANEIAEGDTGAGPTGFLGFISYSQRDVILARRLHLALQSYRVPKRVSVAGLLPDRKIGRFFRDQENLGADPSLREALNVLIDGSRSLIVLCSPNSAQSEWVNREIERFKRRAEPRVFAVIAKGQPHSGNPATECFAPALSQRFNSEGVVIDEHDEPVAPDLQKEPFAKVVARLVSGLLDIPFDDLWQHERRRQRNRTLLVTLVGGVIGLGALVATLETLRVLEAAQLVSASVQTSRDAWRRGADLDRFDLGFRTALASTPTRGDLLRSEVDFRSCDLNGSVTTATCALALSGRALPQHVLFDEVPEVERGNFRDDIPGARGIERRAIHASEYMRAIRFSADSTRVAMLNTNGRLLVFDRAARKVLPEIQVTSFSNGPVALSVDGSIAVAAGSDSISRLVNIDAGEVTELQLTDREGKPITLDDVHDFFLRDQRLLIAGTSFRQRGTYLVDVNEPRNSKTLEKPDYNPPFSRIFHSDGRYLLHFSGYPEVNLQQINTHTGESRTYDINGIGAGVGELKSIAIDASGEWVVLGGNGSDGSTNPVQLVSLSEQKVHQQFIGHTGEISAVAIHTGLRLVASGGSDLTVRLWDMDSGRELIRLAGHVSNIMEIDFSPDGEWLVTTASDARVIAHDLSALAWHADWRERVCEYADADFAYPVSVLQQQDVLAVPAMAGKPLDLCDWSGTLTPSGFFQNLRSMIFSSRTR